MLDLDKLAATLAGRFTQVITEGGAVSAEARAALGRNEVLLHDYAQTARWPLRKISPPPNSNRRPSPKNKPSAITREAINPNILSVLEAQHRANNARASMIRLRNQRLQNRMDLHLALGGDFETRS